MREKTEGEKNVNKLKFHAVLAALLYLALGVVLVGWPGTTTSIICYVIGAVLLFYGLVAILAFLLSKERTASQSLQMVVGVVAAALDAAGAAPLPAARSDGPVYHHREPAQRQAGL